MTASLRAAEAKLESDLMQNDGSGGVDVARSFASLALLVLVFELAQNVVSVSCITPASQTDSTAGNRPERADESVSGGGAGVQSTPEIGT